jgi:hypothetical protein
VAGGREQEDRQPALPEALFEAMHRSPVINLEAPMTERVKLWREDYPHFAEDPQAMVRKLEPLKPLVGKETLTHWMTLATEGRVDELFESVMVRHYDPCYSAVDEARNYGAGDEPLRAGRERAHDQVALLERREAHPDCEVEALRRSRRPGGWCSRGERPLGCAVM